jgi:hypothetical protein
MIGFCIYIFTDVESFAGASRASKLKMNPCKIRIYTNINALNTGCVGKSEDVAGFKIWFQDAMVRWK